MSKKKILLFLIIILVLFVLDFLSVSFLPRPNLHKSDIFNTISGSLLGIAILSVIIIYKFGHKFGIEHRKTLCLFILFISVSFLLFLELLAYFPLHYKEFKEDIAITYGEQTTTKEKSGRVVGVKLLFKTKDEIDFKVDKNKITKEVWTGDCFLAKSRKNAFFLEIYLDQHLNSESETCRKYSNKLDIWLKEVKSKENK